MKFSYSKFPLDQKSKFLGGAVLRPLIPIKISIGDKTINYNALIDSGADFCIFDGEVGDYLGINVKSGDKELFGGIQEGAGLLHICITLLSI